MKILLCVPAYGSEVRVETMTAVASGMAHMLQNVPGAEIRLFTIDLAEIARVRNIFISLAMNDGFDAVILLDADMGVPADTFTRLVMSGHEVCGLTYPKRQIDLKRLYELAKQGVDFDKAKTLALTFICAGSFVHEQGQIKLTDGFLEMTELPGGCLMIRTTALEKMWKKIPDIRQTQDIGDLEARMELKRLIRGFDNIGVGKTKLSEDLSFCRRWRSIGGQIFGLVDQPVIHAGAMLYEGRYLDLLEASAT